MEEQSFLGPKKYTTAAQWASEHPQKTPFHSLYPPQKHRHRQPETLGRNVPWAFLDRRDITSTEGFVMLIAEGKTVGHNGAVVTPDHTLLYDVSKKFGNNPEDHDVFSMRVAPPLQKLESTVAVVATKGGKNYYHWMFDVLPRLHLIQKAGWKADQYVINQTGAPFQEETLAFLGLLAEQIIPSHAQLFLQAKTLVVPSLTHSDMSQAYMPGWVCTYIRDTFLPYAADKRASETPRRIYVSRKQASCRRVCNEQEVMDMLRTYGFVEVCLEEWTVRDQIRLFQEADVIVGPHGAGLTNLVFCKRGTIIIEIFSPAFMNVCYWSLSDHLGLSYRYLIGEGEQLACGAQSFDGYRDITVDVDQLRLLLAECVSDAG